MTEWTTAWGQALTDVRMTEIRLVNTTLELTVPAAVSGSGSRLRLQNPFGDAVRIDGAAVQAAGRVAPATFAGAKSAVLERGEELTTDPVDIEATAGEPIAARLFLAGETDVSSGNVVGAQWRVGAGDQCAGPFTGNRMGDIPLPDWTLPAPAPLLAGVDVRSDAGCAVCLGDSITAGGWPGFAAERLRTRGARFGVVNAGIGGNRLLFDGQGPFGPIYGPAGRSRFDRDVLAVAGARVLVLALGSNDIMHGGTIAPESEIIGSAELIAGYREISMRARAAGMAVVLLGFTPFAGFEMRPSRLDAAQETREWVLSSSVAEGVADAVIDPYPLLVDPSAPGCLAPEFDSGDHLHPNDMGQQVIAGAVAPVLAQLV